MSRESKARPELHRLHASPAGGRGGCSLDLDDQRWRGDGGTRDRKHAVAYRMAFCWNMAEGWPTSALEAGAVRQVDDGTRELLEAIAAAADGESKQLSLALDGGRWDAVVAKAGELRELYAQRDHHYDHTGGRPCDCDTCYPGGKK